MEIVIRAFRATTDSVTCLNFIEGHRRLLELHFGIVAITSSNQDWMYHDNTFVIVAEDKERTKVYGGARVQMADGKLQLPIETAISKYDPSIHAMARQPGVSEICGLWNSTEVVGWGIGSFFMSRAGVAVACMLKSTKVLFLAAPITVRMGKRMGAEIETSLGNKGNFFYPKDDFIATAMAINDCPVLSKADENERKRIYNILEHPVQQTPEDGPKGQLMIDYQLDITG